MGTAEQDYMNMLMASPLFQQINEIQELLEQSATNVPTKFSGQIIGKLLLLLAALML